MKWEARRCNLANARLRFVVRIQCYKTICKTICAACWSSVRLLRLSALPPPAEPLDAAIVSHNCLTPTEVAVLQRVADCGSVREAARALYRSETTLKRELAAVREKLGVATTLQAVVWAIRQGIIR